MGGIYGNAAATALEDCPAPARGLISGMLQQGVSDPLPRYRPTNTRPKPRQCGGPAPVVPNSGATPPVASKVHPRDPPTYSLNELTH